MRVPSPGEYRATARAAGLFTERLNYPLVARLCVVAHRLRLRPTALTIGNLVLGVAASVLVVYFAGSVVGDGRRALVVAVVAWLLWQAAYCLDCCDGQLARVTGTSSAAGGRLDVLCDIAVQVGVVAAVSAVAAAARPGTPSWLVAVFAASWMVNLVTSVMSKEGTNVSLVTSGSLVVRLVKLIRDYPFMISLVCVVLAVDPAWMVVVVVLFSLVNGAFLLASVAQAGRASWRSAG